MKTDSNKRDATGKLKNGVFKEHYKDGMLMCVGKFRNGEKMGADEKELTRTSLIHALEMRAQNFIHSKPCNR
jgi:hypothetical protein